MRSLSNLVTIIFEAFNSSEGVVFVVLRWTRRPVKQCKNESMCSDSCWPYICWLCAEALWQSTGVLWWLANKCFLLRCVLPPSVKKCQRGTEPGSPGGSQKVRFSLLSRLFFCMTCIFSNNFSCTRHQMVSLKAANINILFLPHLREWQEWTVL